MAMVTALLLVLLALVACTVREQRVQCLMLA